MMTVSGFTSLADAEARAPYYRARGFIVKVIEYRSERAGSCIVLKCEARPQ